MLDGFRALMPKGAAETGPMFERGVPVSTAHTIAGAIIGVGAARRMSAVRWGVARRIVTAWFLTMPASAAVAALFYWLGGFVFS